MTGRKRRKYRFSDRAQGEAAYVEADREASLTRMGLNAALHEDADWTGRKGSYRAALYRATGAAGGILLWTFAPGGQAPYTSVHYFDDWARDIQGFARNGSPEGLELCELVSAATVARQRAWDADKAARAQGGAA